MIKGITPKLAEAGKIKIGSLGPEKTSGRGKTYRIPQKHDHFTITLTTRNAAGDLETDEAIMAELDADADGQIRSIPIVLHSDMIDEVFPTAYAMYAGKRCACRGNGETAVRRKIEKNDYTGDTKTVTCPCDRLRATSGHVCKPNGKLYCSIAAPGSAIAGAVHIWRTTSIISIEQMIGSLQQILAVCGTLRGVPLWLRVRPITVEPPGQGAITVYCCHVELRAADIEAIKRQALEAAKLRNELAGDTAGYREMLTLPAHDAETITEQAEVTAEFYPENDSDTETAKPSGVSPSDLAADLETESAFDPLTGLVRLAKIKWGEPWDVKLMNFCADRKVNFDKITKPQAEKMLKAIEDLDTAGGRQPGDLV